MSSGIVTLSVVLQTNFQSSDQRHDISPKGTINILERGHRTMRTLTCDPRIEIRGADVLSIVNNLQAEEIAPFLEKYGLSHIDPNQWYPAINWLSCMNELATKTDF